ncbi:MAG: CotH kinase family protein, partial [Eubacteriales bacterium]|nr:CotH kinase family protein [Eubacteriales bacterium]
MRVLLSLSAIILLLCMLPFYSSAASDRPTYTLPVIYINTEGGQPVERRSIYINAEMKIEPDDNTADFTNLYTEAYNPIEIRGRGNSTWGMPKKPYHIRLGRKSTLFGMSDSRHWILLANAFDGTHLRNALSYDFSGELGLLKIKTIFVELVFNGSYAGIYQLTESIKIAPDRIDITDWEKVAEKTAEAIAKKENMSQERTEKLILSMRTDLSWITGGVYENYRISDYIDISDYDTTGGYLIELDEYYDEVSKFVTDYDVPIMIKSPEFLNTNKEMFGYIRDYINDMEDALFSDDFYNNYGKHYTEYLDLDSFVDYWIANQAFKSVELLFKSAFMYKDAGKPIVFGPVWDMDWSSGNHVNLFASSATYDEWHHSESQDREYWYRAIYDDPHFIVCLQDRWRAVCDILDEYIESIDPWHDRLKDAVEANNRVWGELGGWDFDLECAVFKTWMENRRNWMDEQLNLRDPDIMKMGIRQSADIKLSLAAGSDGGIEKKPVVTIPNTDVYYNGIGTLICDASVLADNMQTLDIYINGLKSGSYKTTGGEVSFEVNTAGIHTADSGRRNVILAVARDFTGKVSGKAYLTLCITGGQMRRVVYASGYDSGDTLTVESEYAVGDTYSFPADSFIRGGYTLIGWTDNRNTYLTGDIYTVPEGSGDLLFTALWQANDGGASGILIFGIISAVLVT